jgi:hypothetical protein
MLQKFATIDSAIRVISAFEKFFQNYLLGKFEPNHTFFYEKQRKAKVNFGDLLYFPYCKIKIG